jgi:hypothetical protein
VEEDQPSAGVGVGGTVVRRTAGRAVKRTGRKVLVALGVKGGFWVGLVVLVLLIIAAAAGAASRKPTAVAVPCNNNGVACTGTGDGSWDAGNIISDAVFYHAGAMTAGQIQAFLDGKGGACLGGNCLRSASFVWSGASVAWCRPVPAGSGSFAVMLSVVSTACGINPQVSLVMIQKESQGLTRVPPAALTGFGCPDTGPGGSANCDAGSAGVWAQTWGMVQAFAHLRADPSRINYPVGQTSQILWNVAETGCGAGPVLVQDTATATLYTYTPYQPNPASLAAYPGTGDGCSSYGNRNFYRLFTEYFGSTGGGKPLAGNPGGAGPVYTPVGLTQNDSQDPTSFGWVHGGPVEPLTWQGHTFGRVAAGTGKLWTAMLDELVPLIPGGLTADLGCYEDRANVNNPAVLSFHAYGLACDVNSGDNPNGAPGYGRSGRYVIPGPQAHDIAGRFCMQWGGDFRGVQDPMHFEIHCTPEQIAAWAATQP